MDVVVWPRSFGLGRYEAAFRENEVDETVLPGLTADDLKELGVAALGLCSWRLKYSNVASRPCDEAKPGQILISPRVLMKVENAVTSARTASPQLRTNGWVSLPLVCRRGTILIVGGGTDRRRHCLTH